MSCRRAAGRARASRRAVPTGTRVSLGSASRRTGARTEVTARSSSPSSRSGAAGGRGRRAARWWGFRAVLTLSRCGLGLVAAGPGAGCRMQYVGGGVALGDRVDLGAFNAPGSGGTAAPAFRDGSSRHLMLGLRTHSTWSRVTSYRPMTLADLGRRLGRGGDAKVDRHSCGNSSGSTGGSPTTFSRCYRMTNGLRLTPSDGTYSRRNFCPHSTIWPRRNGLRYDSSSGRGSRRDWKAGEPMRWPVRRRHFAGTAFTCLPDTWRLRDQLWPFYR
jgi:hypothetical protein